MQNAKCKFAITVSAGRKAGCSAVAACVLFWTCATTALAGPFSFDDIEFWVGEGANRAALVIDWVESAAEPPALAWGYRWDGAATGAGMLAAIVAADDRLFAKLGGSATSPTAVYGLGYDASGDGQFSLNDGTQFDASGIAITGPADLAMSVDPDDYYAEGWFTGFWHYGIETPAGSNPDDGGGWRTSGGGMASRVLVDGAWDSWVFSPTFHFQAFAENPTAALPPSLPLPGDYNGDGNVDARDYDVWRAAFGVVGTHPADGNANGIVDAADYTVWRDHLKNGSERFFGSNKGTSPSQPTKNRSDPFFVFVPEPATWLLLATAWYAVWSLFLQRRKESG